MTGLQLLQVLERRQFGKKKIDVFKQHLLREEFYQFYLSIARFTVTSDYGYGSSGFDAVGSLRIT